MTRDKMEAALYPAIGERSSEAVDRLLDELLAGAKAARAYYSAAAVTFLRAVKDGTR
jgi:hypothetical protein